jgi:hypothetical protein
MARNFPDTAASSRSEVSLRMVVADLGDWVGTSFDKLEDEGTSFRCSNENAN